MNYESLNLAFLHNKKIVLETKIIKLGACERDIEISATKSEIEPYLDAAYLKAQPEIEIKGFRKGKVPLKVIKQYFGKKIEAETLQDISNELFNKAIQEQKIKFIGQPALKDILPNEDGYTFLISYEVIPEFQLSDYRGLAIEEPVHRVSDDEIEHEISHLTINSGKTEPADEILSDLYIAGLTLREVDDATGLPLIGGKPQETQVFLHNHNVMPELRMSLFNKRVGDRFNFKPANMENNAPNKIFNVEVTSISQVIPQEFNDEFVKTYTQGKFEATEDLRQEIGFQLQEEWDVKSREQMEKQIIDKLVESNSFDLPKDVVLEVMFTLFEDIKKRYEKLPETKYLKFEDMQNDLRPIAENRVRWEIIRSQIIEQEGIKVEDFDIEHLVEYEANRTKSDKNRVKKQILENRNIIENILSKKLMDLILDFAITNEVPFEGEDLHDHEHDEEDEHEHEHEQEHEHHDSSIITDEK